MDPKMLAADAAKILGISVQAIHRKIKRNKLESHKAKHRTYFQHEAARTIFGYKFKPKICAFQIVKGGTGKTSLSFQIAVRASLYGARVLCIDVDQQANLTDSFNVDADQGPVLIDILRDNIDVNKCIVKVSPGLDLIPSRIENSILENHLMLAREPLDRVYRQSIIDGVQDDYDLIFFDCPPALGANVTATTLASDFVIAPVIPERYSLRGLSITVAELENINKKYNRNIQFRIIFNKFDGRTFLSNDTFKKLIAQFGVNLFSCVVRQSQDIANSIAEQVSIFDSTRSTSAKEDIDALAHELLEIGDFSEDVRHAAN